MKFTIKLLLLFFMIVGIQSKFVFGQSCSGSLGDPVVNVTFGAGTNPGPALPAGQTSYTYSNSTCIQDGFYGIRTSAVLNSTDNSNCYGGGWLLSTRDHTGDTNGYMMVVNASYTPGEFYRSTISGLCGGTTYEFSSWIMNLLRSGTCSSNPQRFPNVTFNIETTSGTVLKSFSTGNIPEGSTPQWTRYATFFKTPTGVSTVVLRLVNNAPGGCGNDLALDDIQFRACGPTLTVSPVSASLCEGSSITLTGTISAGYNNPVFQWQQSTDNGTTWTNISGATSLTLTVTPALGATQYRVLASELGNINLVTCRIASAPTVNVNVYPYPSLVGTTASICAGTCLNLTSYWNDQNASTSGRDGTVKYINTLADAQANINWLSSSTVCPTSSRSYFVSKTLNGCSSIAEIPVTVKPLPTSNASVSPNSLCAGSTINFSTSANTGATYAWSGPNSFASTNQNPIITNATTAASGVYTLVVTLNGCTATSTTNVSVKPLPSVSATSNSPICAGQTLNLSGTSNGSSFAWSGPNGFTSTTQNPIISNTTPSSGGIYTLLASLNGCTATSNISVVVKNLPTVTASSNSPVCLGKTLNLIAQNGVIGVTYQWNGPNNFTANSQNPSINNVSLAASGTYTLTATQSGCSTTSTTSVTINPLPTPSINSNSPVCVGNAINLSASGGNSYAWNGANGFTSNLQNPTIPTASLSNAGNYTVTVTNANGCSATSSLNVIVNENPIVKISAFSPICAEENIVFNASEAGLGANYLWTGPNGFSSTLQNPMIEQSKPSDSGVYTLSVSLNGCLSTDSATILVKPKPQVSIQSNSPICETETLTLTTSGTSGVSYEWSASNGFTSNIQNPIIQNTSVSNSGIYNITVNLDGCTNSASTNVVIHPKPIALASSSSPICENENLNITTMDAGINAIYDWNGPNGFTSNQQLNTFNNASVNLSGIYSLTVTLGSCSSTSTTEVVVYPKPTLIIDSVSCDPSLKTYHIRLKASGGVVSSTEGIITHLGNDEYLVSGINSATNTNISVNSDKNCLISIPVTAPNCNCPPINAPVSGGNQIICEGETTPTLTATVGLNETIDWYDSITGGNVLSNASTTFTPSQTNAGEYKFYAQTQNIINGCFSSTRTEISFTI